METRKRTGILLHSRHLQAHDWERMMWGAPPDLTGQFSKGILTALRENAEVIVLGCGLRSGLKGEMESEYNLGYIFKNLSSLAGFSDSRGVDLDGARGKIAKITVLDMSSLNTAQEIKFAGEIFEERGIERVIGVTSPTHAPRCLNEALKFYGRLGSKISVSNVSVISSAVGWAPNEDVVVFEPPHRPDDKNGELCIKIAKLLLNPDNLAKIAKTLDS